MLTFTQDTDLTQRFRSPMTDPSPPEKAPPTFRVGCFFLISVELSSSKLFGSGFVRNYSFLYFLVVTAWNIKNKVCSSIHYTSPVCGDSLQGLSEKRFIFNQAEKKSKLLTIFHVPILKTCHDPTTPLCSVSTTWNMSPLRKLISPLFGWS